MSLCFSLYVGFVVGFDQFFEMFVVCYECVWCSFDLLECLYVYVDWYGVDGQVCEVVIDVLCYFDIVGLVYYEDEECYVLLWLCVVGQVVLVECLWVEYWEMMVLWVGFCLVFLVWMCGEVVEMDVVMLLYYINFYCVYLKVENVEVFVIVCVGLDVEVFLIMGKEMVLCW